MKSYYEIGIPMAMKLGAGVGFCYVLRDVLAMIFASSPFIVLFTSTLFFIIPIRLLYKATDMLCGKFNPEWSRNLNGGFVSPKMYVSIQMLNFGIMVFFLAGMIYALFLFIYVTRINPQYITDTVAMFTKMMSESMSAEELSVMQSELNNVTPSSLIVSILFSFSFIGLILSVVNVVILRIKYRNTNKENLTK